MPTLNRHRPLKIRAICLEALEQYKLAQTVAPNEPAIADSIKRIEKQLDDLAESHYRAGLRFRDKGKWDLAKKNS
jgi:hypothetical protein